MLGVCHWPDRGNPSRGACLWQEQDHYQHKSSAWIADGEHQQGGGAIRGGVGRRDFSRHQRRSEQRVSVDPRRVARTPLHVRYHSTIQEKSDVRTGVTAEVDVKATAEDLKNSGKSPNITSFKRIRTAYIEDLDYIFVILSLKHRVYLARNETSELMDGIMEVVSYNAYDLKYLSSSDLSINPSLGTGQVQVKDIHYVSIQKRTTWDFCRLLDAKYLRSSKRSLSDWVA